MIRVNNQEIVFEIFPNGETRIPLKSLLHKDNKMVTIDWKYESDADLMKLFFIKKELDNYSIRIDLLIRYMPYSRMDRGEGLYAFTLKHTSDFINSLEFNSVTVLDPHSEVTPALLNRCISKYPLANYIRTHYCGGDFVFYYPDSGALKKYSKMFEGLGEYAYGVKTRDFATGKIDRLDIVGDVSGKQVIMIDDLCVYGGTFIKGATKLKEMGAKEITLIVTHCEKNIFSGEIPASSLIDQVFTTDSIIEKSEGKVTVFNIENLIR